jgi:hypothetical protein
VTLNPTKREEAGILRRRAAKGRARIVIPLCALLAACQVRPEEPVQIIRKCADGETLYRQGAQTLYGHFDDTWGWRLALVAKEADLRSLCP